MANPIANSLIDPEYTAKIPDNIGTIETSLKTDEGRICVGSAYVDENPHYALFRLKKNGDLDTSFGTGGITTGSFGHKQSLAYSITQLDGGALLIIGLTSDQSYFFDGVPALARFDKNGILDTRFGEDGHQVIKRPATLRQARHRAFSTPPAMQCHVSSIGNDILVLGNFFGLDTVLMKFDRDGNLVPSFNGTGYKELTRGDGNWLHGLNLYASDQGILVCARVYNANSVPVGGCVVSLGPAGEYNSGFGTGGFADFPDTLKILENFLVLPAANRIIGCGMGDKRGGLMVALNDQGVIDESFRSPLLERYYSLAWNQLAAYSPLNADSPILATGIWTRGPDAPMLIGRFHANGELDESFADDGTGYILIDGTTAARRCEILDTGKTMVHVMSTNPNLPRGSLIRCLTQL
ncbi:hypothetical protein ABOC32_08360 [Pseudomonas sp. WOUb67]|uniref:hypothetical protein n=1 Tax=Pseudomonas sp. WOUb67 TaxID=3161136 RepID=UPI003CF950FE